jgi:hypothetical protein
VFGNRVLRIFGPKRQKVTAGWGKFYGYNFHSNRVIRVRKGGRDGRDILASTEQANEEHGFSWKI